MTILKAGLSYFALVFGAGFLLGMVRVPFLVPRLGVRMAELLEMPIMLAVMVLAARFIVARFSLPTVASRIGTGLVALAMVLSAEIAVGVLLAHQSFAVLLSSRDPVSGSVFLALLLVYAALPWWLLRKEPRRNAV